MAYVACVARLETLATQARGSEERGPKGYLIVNLALIRGVNLKVWHTTDTTGATTDCCRSIFDTVINLLRRSTGPIKRAKRYVIVYLFFSRNALTSHFHFPDYLDSQIYDFQFRFFFVCKAGLHRAATGKRVVTA